MRLIGAIAAAVFATCLPAGALAQERAADQAELTEARAIMEIMFPPTEREQTFGIMMAQVADQFRDSLPFDSITDPQLRAMLERYMDSIPERLGPTINAHLPKILEATAGAYTHEFTLDELKDIHTFALTPSGEHYLKRSSALIGDPDVAAANTAFLMDVQQIQRAMQGDMIQELSAYLAEHPEAAAALTGAAAEAIETP